MYNNSGGAQSSPSQGNLFKKFILFVTHHV